MLQPLLADALPLRLFSPDPSLGGFEVGPARERELRRVSGEAARGLVGCVSLFERVVPGTLRFFDVLAQGTCPSRRFESLGSELNQPIVGIRRRINRLRRQVLQAEGASPGAGFGHGSP